MDYEVIDEYVNKVNAKNSATFNKKKKGKNGDVL